MEPHEEKKSSEETVNVRLEPESGAVEMIGFHAGFSSGYRSAVSDVTHLLFVAFAVMAISTAVFYHFDR